MPMRPPPPPPPPALPGLHGMLPGGSAGPLMPLHGLPRLTGLPPNGYGGMMMPTQDAPQHGNSAFPALQVCGAWAEVRASAESPLFRHIAYPTCTGNPTR